MTEVTKPCLPVRPTDYRIGQTVRPAQQVARHATDIQECARPTRVLSPARRSGAQTDKRRPGMVNSTDVPRISWYSGIPEWQLICPSAQCNRRCTGRPNMMKREGLYDKLNYY